MLHGTSVKAQENFKKIYHVYIEKSYIGAVSNHEILKSLISQHEKKIATTYKHLDVDANISIVPELVFDYKLDEAATFSKLERLIAVKAYAYGLFLDGQAVVYVKDQADFEQTVRELMLQFITENELKEWEKYEKTKNVPSELQIAESRITSIFIKQTITGAEVKIEPSKVMTPKQAMKFLITGSAEKIINEQISQPLINVSVTRESKILEEIPYKKLTEKNSEMFKGETKMKQQGTNGEKESIYRIIEENGQQIAQVTLAEKIIVEPVDQIQFEGTKVMPSRGTGDFMWPASGGYISSPMGPRWGTYHKGIDIARPSNYNIFASDNGDVIYTGYEEGFGNKVVINHNNGYQTLYAHLRKIHVVEGQIVPKGTIIGLMGNTGYSKGIHLHFEVEKNGVLIDPETVVSR